MRKKITLFLAMMLFILSASAKKGPKYVFYFIGDGMGPNDITLAEAIIATKDEEI